MSLAEYLAEVSTALATFLRPHRGALHARWLGIDTERRSFEIRRSDNGFTACLRGEWLGAPVVEKWGHAAGQSVRTAFREIDRNDPAAKHFAVGIKRISGECNLELAVDHRWDSIVTLRSPESTLLVVGPECIGGLSDTEFEALYKPGYAGPTPRHGIPEWVLAVVSNLPVGEELRGFDPDPIIAANGLAEAILLFAGLRPAGEPNRYETAATDLRWAVATLSDQNERVLQELIERKPWILLHETDFVEVLPHLRLGLRERLADGSEREILAVPDFVYHLRDSMSLVVEIESSTKRLQTRGVETSYQIPSAPMSHSMFQILNYRNLFAGPLGSQARQVLSKPDAWALRFLLVVGSRLQPGFDERSWIMLREQLYAAGAELRTWDYFIDRLERIAQMAHMDGKI